MKCTQCGKEFEGKFCPECGAPAGENAPASPAVSQTTQVVNQAPKKKRKPLGCLIVIAVFVILGVIGSSGSGSKPDSGSTAQPGSAAASAPAAQKEETAYEIIRSDARSYTNSIGMTWVQVLTEIENTGSANLYLSSGAYDIENAAGDLVKSSTLVSIYPSVIAPGEKAYLYDETLLEEPADGELTVLPRFSAEKARVDRIRFELSEISLFTDDFKLLRARGRVENTSEETSSMTYVVLVLRDAEGRTIGVMFTILMEELAPGDKIGFEMSAMALPDDVTEDAVASWDAFAFPMQMQF